jgi:hypothetical protein
MGGSRLTPPSPKLDMKVKREIESSVWNGTLRNLTEILDYLTSKRSFRGYPFIISSD